MFSATYSPYSTGVSLLPPSQDTRYTLRRPQSAGYRGLPSITNRFLQTDRPGSVGGGGHISRPVSAGFHHAFVTWNPPPAEEGLDPDSFIGIDDDTTVLSSDTLYRTQGTPATQNVPTRPSSAASFHADVLRTHLLPPVTTGAISISAWESPDKGAPPMDPRCCAQQVGALGALNKLSSTTLDTGAMAPLSSATANDRVSDDAASPSKRVSALREATTQARKDADPPCGVDREGITGEVLRSECSAEVRPTKEDPSQLMCAPSRETADSILARCVSTNNGRVQIKAKVLGIAIPESFVDFVQRDKFFEAATATFATLEFDRRLEVTMEQTTRRNALYVAMTKVYLRWAETGLDPSEPDPPNAQEMERVILRDQQHRRNVDNIVLREEKERASLTDTLLNALGSYKRMLYLLLEQEAVRAHIVSVYEPERWASLTLFIMKFLETHLVTASALWKAWSLQNGVIERQEGWERSQLHVQLSALSRTVKLRKIEAVEASARGVVEREERTTWKSMEYQISIVAVNGQVVSSNDADAATNPNPSVDDTSAEPVKEGFVTHAPAALSGGNYTATDGDSVEPYLHVDPEATQDAAVSADREEADSSVLIAVTAPTVDAVDAHAHATAITVPKVRLQVEAGHVGTPRGRVDAERPPNGGLDLPILLVESATPRVRTSDPDDTQGQGYDEVTPQSEAAAAEAEQPHVAALVEAEPPQEGASETEAVPSAAEAEPPQEATSAAEAEPPQEATSAVEAVPPQDAEAVPPHEAEAVPPHEAEAVPPHKAEAVEEIL